MSYIIYGIDKWVDATVTHCQHVTCHPNIIDARKAVRKHSSKVIAFDIGFKRFEFKARNMSRLD